MKQPVSILVSTQQRNQYPELIKLRMIKTETKAELAIVLEDSIVMLYNKNCHPILKDFDI